MAVAACGEPASPEGPPSGEPAERDAAAATPAPPPPLPRPTDPAAFVGQHVLVPDGATLHLGPEAGAATVVLRLPAAAGERAPRPAAAMRVAGHEGGRLMLQPAAPELGCVPPLSGLEGLDVAVWVEPAALARVVGRGVEARFADGTSVKLRPGVLVGPPGERVEVSADGLRLAVPIAEGDVSTLYAAEPAPAVPTGLRKLEPGAPLAYAGGDPVLPESALVGGGLVLAQRTDGDRTLVRVASRCAEVEAVVEPARLVRGAGAASAPGEAEGVASAEPREPSPPVKGRYAIRGPSEAPRLTRGGSWSVAAGKALTWPSGVAAGTTTAGRTFEIGPTTRGDRSCFAVAPSEAAVAEGETLPICVRSSEVTHDDPVAIAASAGILGLLASEPGHFEPSPFDSLLLPGDDAGLADALGGSDLEAGMGGALVLGGGGRGGGGTGEGTLGLGTLGTGSGYGSGGGGGPAGPSSEVKAGSITATGLEQQAVAKLVARSRNQLRFCHEKQLASDPTLAGSLSLSLEVAGGAVTRAVAESETLPAALLRCIERSAERWSLSGDGTAEIPLTLSLAE